MTDAERARERDHTENHDTNDESEDTSQVADANVPGQLIYPDRVVDAERAAAFAAGKVPTLDPADEDSEADEDDDPEDEEAG